MRRRREAERNPAAEFRRQVASWTQATDEDAGSDDPADPDERDPDRSRGIVMDETREPPLGTGRRPARSGRVRLSAVIALALAAGLVAWLVLRSHSGSTGSNGPALVAGASAVSPAGIRNEAVAVGHPIFWLGP